MLNLHKLQNPNLGLLLQILQCQLPLLSLEYHLFQVFHFELKFDKDLTFGLVYKGKESEVKGNTVSIKKVGAGEGFLLYVKEN